MSTNNVNNKNNNNLNKHISNSNTILNDTTRHTPIKSILKKTNNSLNKSWLQIKKNLENNQFKDDNNRYSSLADMYLDLTLNKTDRNNTSLGLLNFPDILETSFRHNVINDPNDSFYNEFENNSDVISLNVDYPNEEEFEKETFKFEMDPKKLSLELSFSNSSKEPSRPVSQISTQSSSSSITYYDDFYVSNKLNRKLNKEKISKSTSCLVKQENKSNSLSSFSSLTSSSYEKPKKEFLKIKSDVRIYENICMFAEFDRKIKFKEEQKLMRREQFLIKNTRILPKRDGQNININILDDFLLINIFSRLNTIEKLMLQFVCKRWYHIVWSTEYTYKLFKSIDIASDSLIIYKPIPKVEPVKANLTFKFFRKQKTKKFKSSNSNHPGARLLNIDSILKFLFTKLVNRQTYPLCLCVEKIRIKNTNRLSDRGLDLIASLCPELKHLTLKNCLSIRSNAIEKILENCENLKYLDLTGSYNLTNLIIRINCKSDDKVKNNGGLNNFYRKFMPNTKTNEIPNQFRIAQYLYLEFIDLSFCSNVTDKSLESLCKTCIYIKNLYLRRCKQISDIGVLYIAKYCVNLRELSLCQCAKVSDTGIKYLANDKILHSSSKNSFNDAENLHGSKNKDFKYKIKYLSLAECPLITDYSLIYLCKLGFFKNIKYLNLRGCTKITDKFTKYFVGSNMIVKLIQNEFTTEAETNFSKLKMKFMIPFDLKSIDLSKCSISDKSIEYLCRLAAINPDSLQRLSLRSCDDISDYGIKHLAINCKNLQSLNVTKCNKVTAQSLKEIKKNCPSCVIQHTNFSFC
ncbi:unnamed protein product [Brachionus calyciflorus]|uniref:F-box domain-containing protein n=1 Tax=Brachionus calyciflorus TaxID=104777 RepID=A0A814G1R2_9BILA|nr:unnamed protein product [Brachionus calyciflorus]